jgi:nitroreductase
MDVFEAIGKRYSHRGEFTAAPVAREDLVKIVLAGMRAPSAKNDQVTSFVIVDQPEQVQAVAQILDRPVCYAAKAIIVCVTDPRAVFQGLSFAVEDCAAAVENMLLAATALGYASVWVQGCLRLGDTAERLGRLLGVPEGHQVQIALPIGVPAQTGTQAPRQAFEQRAWFNRWGG